MLNQKGFDEKWTSWIYGCISTVGYYIIINGRQRDYIQATRGLRQGDPLSPCLFIIAMGYLSSLVEDAQNRGLIKGFITRNNSTHISHLLFADDILLFLVDEASYLQNLQYIIKAFEIAFGLKINLAKFFIAGINIDVNTAAIAYDIWGCSIQNLLIDYLGMPLGGNPKLRGFWDPIIEHINRKLSLWQLSYISKGGRLTLIQAALSSIPTYFLSLFKAPVAVCNSIERLMRNFFLNDFGNQNGSHLVRWDIVTRPKDKGGLGIDRIRVTNEELLGKWIWRYFTKPGLTLA